MEVEISRRDGDLHQKLFVALRDWREASGYAKQLLSKGWHSKPAYLRRGSVSVLQQAVTDALIVSYMRPWSPVVLAGYQWTGDDKAFHERVRTLRNKVVGHSTPPFNTVRLNAFDGGTIFIEVWPHPYFSENELLQMVKIISDLSTEAERRRKSILVQYPSLGL